MLKIHTIQIAQWRKAQRKGIRITDTTVRSGLKWLAPNWQIVLDIKQKRITEAEYLVVYKELMKKSQVEYPELWDELIKQETLCLACYCPHGVFCHRHCLADMVKEYAEQRNIGSEILGEILE